MWTPHSPKPQHHWNLTIRLFSVISRTLSGRVLPLCRGAVSIFYSPSRLGNKKSGWGFQTFWTSNTHTHTHTHTYIYISLYCPNAFSRELELFKMELFWHLTVYKQNKRTLTKLNCLKKFPEMFTSNIQENIFFIFHNIKNIKGRSNTYSS